MFFKDKETITVNGVSFNMILVEGDKFCIGTKEIELDDFYMAEIPVTQELYAAVMQIGYGHTKSYGMMPDNFDYLHPNYGLPSLDYRLFGSEPNEEYQKRVNRERSDKYNRELKERERILELSRSLPVNHISWLECIEFIKKLNSLTGRCFGLPSFEQWYFAASGGIKSKGYAFSGSNRPNSVGHFYKVSKRTFTTGSEIKTKGSEVSINSKSDVKWYTKPMQYQPNELGIYDMSGLVYEWLDKAGYVIGGSYHSDPDQVDKSHRYGFSHYCHINSYLTGSGYLIEKRCVVQCKKRSYDDSIASGDLFGFRLILLDHPKRYDVPNPIYSEFKVNVTDIERHVIEYISQTPNLGLLRRVIANRYEAGNRLGAIPVYKDFKGNIYDVFVCPQNLTGFHGTCFDHYHSRRKFVRKCIEEFKIVLKRLCERGYNLLIDDELGVDLSGLGFTLLSLPDFSGCKIQSFQKQWIDYLQEKSFLVNNQNVIETRTRIIPYPNPKCATKRINTLKIVDNLILINIRLYHNVHKSTSLESEWITNSVNRFGCDKVTRITLNCFCDFHSEENNCDKEYSVDCFRTEGIVRFMREKLLNNASRFNLKDFNTSELINKFFCRRSFGGEFAYDYPASEGLFVVQDESFFILPQLVYNEWKESLIGDL